MWSFEVYYGISLMSRVTYPSCTGALLQVDVTNGEKNDLLLFIFVILPCTKSSNYCLSRSVEQRQRLTDSSTRVVLFTHQPLFCEAEQPTGRRLLVAKSLSLTLQFVEAVFAPRTFVSASLFLLQEGSAATSPGLGLQFAMARPLLNRLVVWVLRFSGEALCILRALLRNNRLLCG